MVLISLGVACLVRQSIDIFNEFRVETNFFDWLMTNFTTALFIFQNLDNPNSFLTHDKFTDKGMTDNNPTHRFVQHNDLYMISLHDFPAEMDYWSYVEAFIEKYKRRMNRLKQIILTCQEKINFIHYVQFVKDIPTLEQVYLFLIAIQEMNPYCNFCLYILIPPELYSSHEEINKLQISNNIRIKYMQSNNQPINLQRTDLNWKEIYQHIQHS